MKLKAFIKRNILEILRDPLLYVFCILFPLFMVILFQMINVFIDESIETFTLRSLIPGIIMFSYTFVMLVMSIKVSKDKKTALLKRLYISPLKTTDFVFGYSIVGIGLCLFQTLMCILFGYLIAIIKNELYFSFTSSLLLTISSMPIGVSFVFFGIFMGSCFNENSAPGISSVLITVTGLLGGCWMPLETMKGFVNFCEILPFYQTVSLGRMIVGARNVYNELYEFSLIGIMPIVIFLILSIVLAIVVFKRQMKKD